MEKHDFHELFFIFILSELVFRKPVNLLSTLNLCCQLLNAGVGFVLSLFSHVFQENTPRSHMCCHKHQHY